MQYQGDSGILTYYAASTNHMRHADWTFFEDFKVESDGVVAANQNSPIKISPYDTGFTINLATVPSQDAIEKDPSGRKTSERYGLRRFLRDKGASQQLAELIFRAADLGCTDLRLDSTVKPAPGISIFDPETDLPLDEHWVEIGTEPAGVRSYLAAASNHLTFADWEVLREYVPDQHGISAANHVKFLTVASTEDGYDIQIVAVPTYMAAASRNDPKDAIARSNLIDEIRKEGFSDEFVSLYFAAVDSSCDYLSLDSAHDPLPSYPLFSSDTGEEITQEHQRTMRA